MFTNLSFIALFLTSGTLAVLGNLLLKAGMNNLGSFEIGKLISNWQLVLGFVFYGVSSILYLRLIQFGEVTKIYPAVVSYMFIVLLILGAVFLKEELTLVKAVGIGVIILGIVLGTR